MASWTEHVDSKGNVFYKVQASNGRNRKINKTWRPEPGWSRKTVDRELHKFAANLEKALANGEILPRKERVAKKAAEAKEAEKLKTFRRYADSVYMAAKETTFSENARSCYRMFLDKHIFPSLGDFLMVEITPAMLSKLIMDYQKKGYAHASAVKLYNILNGVFDMAFMDDSIPVNPMLKVKRPVQRRDEQIQDSEDKAYSLEELNYIEECARKEPLKWRAFIFLLNDTGMRKGEACGLQWSDVDFKEMTVTIQRSLQYTPDKGIYEDLPKNGKIRKIDLGAEVVSMLRELREEQAQACISKWVFSQDGKPDPIHPQSPTRYFKKFGDRYGVKGFHPHKLRHTWASLAEKNGADIASIALRLGHSDSSVTMRMYVHADLESIKKAGERVRTIRKRA